MTESVCVIGTVATAPRFTANPGKAAFCSFRLASTERRYDPERKQWADGGTNWFTINTFRSLAEHASRSFAKGDRVIVHGRMRVRDWEQEGKSGTSVDIEADAVGHDLRWGTTRFTRRSVSTSAPQGEVAGDSQAASPAGGESSTPSTDAPFGQSNAGTEQVGWLAATHDAETDGGDPAADAASPSEALPSAA